METQGKNEIKEENLCMPKYGKHKIENCRQKFKSFFIDNMQNLSQLKQIIVSLAINANLQNELIRPTSWKIFLNTLSSNNNTTIKTWLEETYDKRKEFKEKLNKYKPE